MAGEVYYGKLKSIEFGLIREIKTGDAVVTQIQKGCALLSCLLPRMLKLSIPFSYVVDIERISPKWVKEHVHFTVRFGHKKLNPCPRHTDTAQLVEAASNHSNVKQRQQSIYIYIGIQPIRIHTLTTHLQDRKAQTLRGSKNISAHSK
jgi:hypothetical protein